MDGLIFFGTARSVNYTHKSSGFAGRHIQNAKVFRYYAARNDVAANLFLTLVSGNGNFSRDLKKLWKTHARTAGAPIAQRFSAGRIADMAVPYGLTKRV